MSPLPSGRMVRNEEGKVGAMTRFQMEAQVSLKPSSAKAQRQRRSAESIDCGLWTLAALLLPV